MNMKEILLLIGAKGSGKSFIGQLLQDEFGITFLRVEDWAKKVKEDRSIDEPSYLEEVFVVIEAEVRRALVHHDRVVFESTGLTPHFDRMISSLGKDYSVKTIKVVADHELCLNRVKNRDQEIHVAVSDHQVNAINQMVEERNLQTDFLLINESKGKDALRSSLLSILSD